MQNIIPYFKCAKSEKAVQANYKGVVLFDHQEDIFFSQGWFRMKAPPWKEAISNASKLLSEQLLAGNLK